MVGTAHFIKLANSIMMITGSASSSPATLYACSMSWGDNQLIISPSYVLAAGVPVNSLHRADCVPCQDGEWLFVFRRSDRIILCSFMPSLAGVIITRAWQTIMLPVVSNDTGVAWLGNHLIILQNSTDETIYRVSELALRVTDFSLVTSGVAATGNDVVGGVYYQPYVLDYNRLLIQGGDPFNNDFAELRILNRYAGGDELDHIVSHLLDEAGYDPSDYDVSVLADQSVTGYVVQPPLTARAALEPLRIYGAFDLVEHGDQLRAVIHHATIDCDIPASELRATKDGQQSSADIVLRRIPELDLPQMLTIDYSDPAQDFEIGSQQASRILTQATAHIKLHLPVVCSADQARQLAEQQLYTAWAEREHGLFSLSRRYVMLEPSDVVRVAGQEWRIQKIQQTGGLLQCEAVRNFVLAEELNTITDASVLRSAALLTPVPTQFYLMDMPPLTAEADQAGIYVAGSGGDGWSGGSLWRAMDDNNYQLQDRFISAATVGVAVTLCAMAAHEYSDNASTVEVQLLRGTLTNCTQMELLNGANVALLGDEIIQFQTAILLGNGYYRLSGLLRGRRGTEAAAATHVLGERFILLERTLLHFMPLVLSDRNKPYYYKATTTGQNLSDCVSRLVSSSLRCLQPLAPVQLRGIRAAGVGGDVAISWVRRARLNGEWVDYIDVPLDEDNEQYELEICDGGNNLKRTVLALTQTDYLYSSTQQIIDFGAAPSSFIVRIYQISMRYGRGAVAVATI